MSRQILRLLFAAALAVPASFAQFEIYQVQGSVELAVPPLYELGSFHPGESGAVRFRIRNISAAPAALNVLAVNGSGFSLSGAPSLPAGLASQQAVEFQVIFQSATPGAYSASLDSEGFSVLLTATVVQSLTYGVDSQTLGVEPLDFGSVELGSSLSKHFTIQNQTEVALAVPAISVVGGGFSLTGIPPSGVVLPPQQATGFDVQFQPTATGTWTASLAIGDRTYALTGIALAVALPKPSIEFDLPQPHSAQQGTATVKFDAPARAAGTGFVSLEFQPQPAGASDPAVQFAAGGLKVPFSVAPGDTQASFGFQTGTTAGTLAFTVDLGGNSDRKTIVIPSAAVVLTASQGVRSAGTVEVRLTGFDNTRSVSRMTYTFFDAAGNAVPPGALAVDSASDFARYFQGSDAGGNFQLRAIFPVTGDASKIVAFEAAITSSAGTADTGRVTF
jgi:Cep192 domain 4